MVRATLLPLAFLFESDQDFLSGNSKRGQKTLKGGKSETVRWDATVTEIRVIVSHGTQPQICLCSTNVLHDTDLKSPF